MYSDGPNTCAGTVESNWTVPHFGCLSFGGSSFILSCNAQGAYVAKYVVPDCPFTGPYASPSTTSYSLGCTLGSTQVTGLSSYAACTNATGELVEVTTYSSGSCNGTSGNGTESSAVTLLSGMCNAYGGSGFQVNVTGLLITYAVYDNVLCQGDPLKYTAVLAPAARTQYGLLHTGSEGLLRKHVRSGQRLNDRGRSRLLCRRLQWSAVFDGQCRGHHRRAALRTRF